ncbi:nitronate monooxygenase [Halomonas elongata]|uniref:NAD(P)H-dependent flavin oxidoreductase n=1 Tax=Halomonas elongata TaxID=2746 RepID=UPI002E2A8D84|nr:nitronate monooxygenase [Halomonas elongata]WVI72297.1 nitronate monooxygenase [Halomonas elongata]
MSSADAFLQRLGLRYPIIQAPMAGVSTPEMAAAVTQAGGLGSLGLGALSVERAREQIHAARELTTEPINVNLFCHCSAGRDSGRELSWLGHLAPYFAEFDARPPDELREIYRSFVGHDEMLEMLCMEQPAVVSFHFGLPGREVVQRLREAGCMTLACVTSLEEAERAESEGVDALVAQGIEAGGHRGVFNAERDDGIGTLALVRLLVARTWLPVVAAGGIMDGAGINAALQLGAAAAQLGTAFVLCPESAADAAYRERLKGEGAHHTRITAAISGRPARGLVNRFHEIADDTALPDYPVAYDAAKALHAAARAAGNHDFAPHWAGQGAPLARELPAASLVGKLAEEMQEAQRH